MEYAVHDRIAFLSLDRPERANALDIAGWHALRAAVDRADADPDVRVVVLGGKGKNFCAGIDLSVLQEMKERFRDPPPDMREQVEAFITDLQDCITALERCRKPVIAAVHGACIGGGVDLITACDIRFCCKQSTFSVKEVDLGIVADLGTLQRLPRIVNPGIAAELAFTARTFDGREAHHIGLVSEVLNNEAQLQYRVGEVAAAIARKPPRIVAGIKRTLLQQRDRPVADGLAFVAKLSSGLMTGEA